MDQDFSNRVAAITGAASSIGLECARTLLTAGARVALVDRDADRLRAICAALGDRAIPIVVDLTNHAEVNEMLPQILAKTGQLDTFHAYAGSYFGGQIVEGDPDQWDRMLNLNINAAFRSVRAVLPHRVEMR